MLSLPLLRISRQLSGARAASKSSLPFSRSRRIFTRSFCSSKQEHTSSDTIPRKLLETVPFIATKLGKLKSVENARLEASVLLAVALNESREEVVTNYKRVLDDREAQLVKGALEQRLKEKPIAYIAGKRDFFGRSFLVSPGVTLIPRPATETLVSETLDRISKYFDRGSDKGEFQFLELGVGTGCILATLLAELNGNSSKSILEDGVNVKKALSKWTGTGVDISGEALKIAKENAILNKVDHLASFYESNWTKELIAKHGVRTKFDVVVSNPPYLTNFDWETAPETMTLYEPSIAFVAGEDGLDCYRSIYEQAPRVMAPGALLCLEIGAWQENGVKSIFTANNTFSFVKNAKDLDGHMRCLIFKLKGSHTRARK